MRIPEKASVKASKPRATDLLRDAGRILVVDVETTGFVPADGRVVELALVEFHGDQPISTFASPLRGILAPRPRQLKNAVPVAALKGAPSFKSLAPTLKDLVEGADLVLAQNAKFDVSWLASEFSRAGVAVEFPEVVDLIDVSKAAWPGLKSYALDAVAARADVEVRRPRHRALPDALTEHDVLLAAVDVLCRRGDLKGPYEFKKRLARPSTPGKPLAEITAGWELDVAEMVDKLGRGVAQRQAAETLTDSLEVGLLDLSEARGLRTLRGRQYFAQAGSYEVWEALEEGAETDSILREILTKAGVFNAVAEVNPYLLGRALKKGLLPKAVESKLKEYGRLSRVRRLKFHPAG
jgi:DNA polymerase-3 subunit epsilon